MGKMKGKILLVTTEKVGGHCYLSLYTPQSRYPLTLACHSPNQVTVDDHHPFRSPGGAAGVHNNSEVRRDGLHYWYAN